MFAWLYGKLKHCRLLSRSIDKIKDANPGSAKRTFQWLWGQLVELLDELREIRSRLGKFSSSRKAKLLRPPNMMRNLLQIPFPHLLPHQLPLRQRGKQRKVKARVEKGRVGKEKEPGRSQRQPLPRQRPRKERVESRRRW